MYLTSHRFVKEEFDALVGMILSASFRAKQHLLNLEEVRLQSGKEK